MMTTTTTTDRDRDRETEIEDLLAEQGEEFFEASRAASLAGDHELAVRLMEMAYGCWGA